MTVDRGRLVLVTGLPVFKPWTGRPSRLTGLLRDDPRWPAGVVACSSRACSAPAVSWSPWAIPLVPGAFLLVAITLQDGGRSQTVNVEPPWSPNVRHSVVLGEQQRGVGWERRCTVPG